MKECTSPTPARNSWSMNHEMRAGHFSVASALKTTFVILMGKMWSVINRKREKISRDYSKCQTSAVVLNYVTVESHLKHSWVWVKIQRDLKEIWVFFYWNLWPQTKQMEPVTSHCAVSQLLSEFGPVYIRINQKRKQKKQVQINLSGFILL